MPGSRRSESDRCTADHAGNTEKGPLGLARAPALPNRPVALTQSARLVVRWSCSHGTGTTCRSSVEFSWTFGQRRRRRVPPVC